MLPDSLLVLERGWLSSNNIVFFEGEQAAVIDSGYLTHAAQTLALLAHALDGRRLTRPPTLTPGLPLISAATRRSCSRSAARSSFLQEIDATIAEWDEEALLLSPLGQSAARFQHDQTIAEGDQVELGGLVWNALRRSRP